MKHYKYNLFSIGLAATAMLFASCSDQFLEDKKNYDNVTPDVYNYYEGAYARLSDAYSFVLPNSNSSANYRYPCTGLADDQSKSTEEYYGFGVFVDPQNIMKSETGNSYLPDYFMGDKTNIQASVYGYIRNINDVIIGIEESSLDEKYKEQFLGQAYFLRAWRYYQLVKWYGGVPIVTSLLDPTEDAYTPRSTTKETIEFILSDLKKSAELLEPYTASGGWQSSSDWGRVTTGTALALKGRVLLLWASPIFNRANDESRWTNAYNEMKADLPKIQACGYGLYNAGNDVNGSAFAQIFTTVKSPENVFVTVRSSVDPDENGYYNAWEETIRPRNTNGKGSLIPSEMIISQFPMKDGKRPANSTTYTKLAASDYNYEKEYPFMNRDPRFYRTFVFPGMRWAYQGDPTKSNSDNPSYDSGKNYELWSYVWYTDASDAGDVDKSTCYGADNLLSAGNKSVYVRKRSDDADVNTPLYTYNEGASDNKNFRLSGAPYIELRYAEVLLNYAEAACMAGQMSEAVNQIKAVRQRAGYTGDCGLEANLSSNQAACMSAILYERQIEFAYEGKRFDDMRRWMLFDGGSQTVAGAPSTWKLTGWGGNTCTWLGVTPLNGQRREGIEYRTADAYGVGKTTKDSDPLVVAGVERCAAVDFRKALYNITVTGEGTEDETTEDNGQLATLKNWYKANLVYKQKKGDGRLSNNDVKTDLYIQFRPEYYFLGFTQGVMTANKQLGQTIGWDNPATGGTGDFDPLAE
jgi:hypothetical protein